MKGFWIRITLAAMLLTLPQPAQAQRMLIPGGQVVGLELQNDTVTVAAFAENSPAETAGVRVGDRILRLDGQQVSSPKDIQDLLNCSDGSVELELERSGEALHLTVFPQPTDQGPRLGVYLRQGVTGVGTVTYYDPESGTFATLGHGVTTPSGSLLQLRQGYAYEARVASVRKGKAGEPGQLIGALDNPSPIGNLIRNTQQGVFGETDQAFPGTPLEIATWEQVHTGQATILSTIEGRQVQEYSVQILKIYPAGRRNGRNLLIKVTDEALLSATGGIVQGMSGSPIIQDGKLVGAVTHVLVNDPTTGYGIFIENMLDAAA